MSIFQPYSALPSTKSGRTLRLLKKGGAAGAVCGALVAATLSTAIPSQASTPAANKASAVSLTQHPGVAQGVLVIINQERAANHLPAVLMNTKLISSAYNHNAVMAQHNLMSHQCTGEASLGDRIDAVHYNWSTAGENLGWTTNMSTAGANGLQVMMYNEKAPNDGHRLVTLSRAYRDVGVSVVTDATHEKLWLTVDFGHLM